MTDDLLARLAALNPEPDPDKLVKLGGVGVPAHPELRAILEGARVRRNGQPRPDIQPPWEPETRPDDTKGPEGGGGRPRFWMLAAAATLAAVAIAAVVPRVLGPGLFDRLGSDEATQPTAVFTGDACIYEGPDTFAVDNARDFRPDREREQGRFFTVRNISDVTAFINVAEIPDGTTLGELVASFPVIEDERNPPPSPAELITWRQLDPGEEGDLLVRPRNPGRYGISCMPFDGSPGVPGSVFLVTE